MMLYEFVAESYGGIECTITLVNAESAQEALIEYCKDTGELNDAFMEAIRKVGFDNAMSIANSQLSSGIISVHEVGNTIYTRPNYRIHTIGEDTV